MIRFATPFDADVIAEIHVLTWRYAYRGIVPDSVLDSLSVATRAQGWRRGIEADPRCVFVAEAEDRIVGWIAIGSCRDDDAKSAGEVYAIYVRPEAWGGGVGRSLMEKGEEELLSRGFPRILLWVLDTNARSMRFYESIHYVADGVTKIVTLGDAALTEARYEKRRTA